MSYLSVIKKLRLKTKWDESETHRSVTGNPDSQWTLLIDCGKKGWIGLKSINPPLVHYYRQGKLAATMRQRLEKLGAVIDPCDGEMMVFVPLAKLPELCKLVRARKKRKAPLAETTAKGLAALSVFREQAAGKGHENEQGAILKQSEGETKGRKKRKQI